MIRFVFLQNQKIPSSKNISFSPNEHFLDQQDGNEEERITDTSFKIEGKETKKYHLECQSSTDNRMLVRFFEYDTPIALDEGQIKNKLEELLNQGVISEYTRCTLIDMSNKVLEHIAVKYNSVKEGVKAVMGGKVLEYEAKTIKREGIEQGIKDTVSILKNLGIPTQLVKIQEQYNLSPEAAKKYL